MSHRRLGPASIIFTILLFYSGVATAFEAEFRLPCMIDYRGKPEIVVTCLVRIHISKEIAVETVKTPNGGTFIIENDKSDTNKWYLDHATAVKTSDEPISCYRNDRVQICF
jgi:hypothetical protein